MPSGFYFINSRQLSKVIEIFDLVLSDRNNFFVMLLIEVPLSFFKYFFLNKRKEINKIKIFIFYLFIKMK